MIGKARVKAGDGFTADRGRVAEDRKAAMNQIAILYVDRFTRNARPRRAGFDDENRGCKWFAVLLSLAAAACGGGGGDAPPSPAPGPRPEPLPPLTATFEAHGSTLLDALRPPLPRVVRSSTEFASLPPTMEGRLPAGYAQPDYSQKAVLFLEYLSVRDDEYGAASIGIEAIESDALGATHVISAEFCRYAAVQPAGEPASYRVYSFYETRAFTGTVSFRWTERLYPDCKAVPYPVLMPNPAPRPLVASGGVDLNLSGPLNPPPQRLIRNQQEWNEILPRIAQAVPQEYQAPDFSQLNLVYLQGYGDWGDSYIRLQSFRSTADGARHEFEAEYCGAEEGLPNHVPFALYRLPVLTGEAHFTLYAPGGPPYCVTRR